MMVVANDDSLSEADREKVLQDMQQELNITHGNKKEKILNIGIFIKNLRSDVHEIKEELKGSSGQEEVPGEQDLLFGMADQREY